MKTINCDAMPAHDISCRIVWLHTTFGKATANLWFYDVQPSGVEDLVMSKEIYFFYRVRFPDE